MKSREVKNDGVAKDISSITGYSVLSPTIIVWVLHWTSALLVLFLLTTSLTSGLGITRRLFPGSWMDWHLSVGILLLVVTVVRLKFSLSGKLLPPMRLPIAQRIKGILVLTVLVAGVSGLTIFQKPPFGRSGMLFGSFPMPTLIRLDHSVHYVIIDLHIVLSCAIAALLIWHIKEGFQRLPSDGQSRLTIMLWPWRKGSKTVGLNE
jgi:cytochrome b561